METHDDRNSSEESEVVIVNEDEVKLPKINRRVKTTKSKGEDYAKILKEFGIDSEDMTKREMLEFIEALRRSKEDVAGVGETEKWEDQSSKGHDMSRKEEERSCSTSNIVSEDVNMSNNNEVIDKETCSQNSSSSKGDSHSEHLEKFEGRDNKPKSQERQKQGEQSDAQLTSPESQPKETNSNEGGSGTFIMECEDEETIPDTQENQEMLQDGGAEDHNESDGQSLVDRLRLSVSPTMDDRLTSADSPTSANRLGPDDAAEPENNKENVSMRRKRALSCSSDENTQDYDAGSFDLGFSDTNKRVKMTEKETEETTNKSSHQDMHFTLKDFDTAIPLSTVTPLKRHYRKVIRKESTQKNLLFCADLGKVESYQKIILQLFNIYHHKLKLLQSQSKRRLEWGEPVKPGLHCENSIDVKRRGEIEAYNSDENDVVMKECEVVTENNIKKNSSQDNSLFGRMKDSVLRFTRSRRCVIQSRKEQIPVIDDDDDDKDFELVSSSRSKSSRKPPNERKTRNSASANALNKNAVAFKGTEKEKPETVSDIFALSDDENVKPKGKRRKTFTLNVDEESDEDRKGKVRFQNKKRKLHSETLEKFLPGKVVQEESEGLITEIKGWQSRLEERNKKRNQIKEEKYINNTQKPENLSESLNFSKIPHFQRNPSNLSTASSDSLSRMEDEFIENLEIKENQDKTKEPCSVFSSADKEMMLDPKGDLYSTQVCMMKEKESWSKQFSQMAGKSKSGNSTQNLLERECLNASSQKGNESSLAKGRRSNVSFRDDTFNKNKNFLSYAKSFAQKCLSNVIKEEKKPVGKVAPNSKEEKITSTLEEDDYTSSNQINLVLDSSDDEVSLNLERLQEFKRKSLTPDQKHSTQPQPDECDEASDEDLGKKPRGNKANDNDVDNDSAEVKDTGDFDWLTSVGPRAGIRQEKIATYTKKNVRVKPVNKPREPQVIPPVADIPCPLCNAKFTADEIEAHAADCDGNNDNEDVGHQGIFREEEGLVSEDAAKLDEDSRFEPCCVCDEIFSKKELEDHVTACLEKAKYRQQMADSKGYKKILAAEYEPRSTRSRSLRNQND